MLAQSTLREGLSLAQSWGPLGISFVGIIFYHIYNNIHIRKRAYDPASSNAKKINLVFAKCDKLFEKDAELSQAIAKCTTHHDIEDKLIKYQLKEVCDTQFKSVDTRLTHMETLLSDIHVKILSSK